MAYRRSQPVVYETNYLVDSINQRDTSQGYYKLRYRGIGGSKIREHCGSSGKRLWMHAAVGGLFCSYQIRLRCANFEIVKPKCA